MSVLVSGLLSRTRRSSNSRALEVTALPRLDIRPRKSRNVQGSRPLPVWPPPTVVEAAVGGGVTCCCRAAGLRICSRQQEDIVFFFLSFSFMLSFCSCFKQSAMAYMVCCGPKIRRRKLNNVFLFFKGEGHAWLITE